MKRSIGTLEPWSTKEKLCLSSAVLKCGDQSWITVSRQMRVFGEPDMPTDWYSPKQCALQYDYLLNNIATMKRKKRSEKGVDVFDTPAESLVRRLLQERQEELRFLIEQDRIQYMHIKKDIEDIENGKADDRLEEFVKEMQEEVEKEAANASILRQHEERSKLESGRVTPHSTDNTCESTESKVPTSPLLTSLLQSPAGYRGMHNMLSPQSSVSKPNDSPTLSRLLESPAKQPEPIKPFTLPVKSEEITQEMPNKAEPPTSSPMPEESQVVSEQVEEVQTSSPASLEIKAEEVENLTEENLEQVPEEVIEEVAELQIQDEGIEVLINSEEEIKEGPTLTPKTENEDIDGDKDDPEQSSLTLQDSDTTSEEQHISELDCHSVNMIVAGEGIISLCHDKASENSEETSLQHNDIQQKDDSDAAESVKDFSIDDVGDESAKDSKIPDAEAVDDNTTTCQSNIEVDNFIIGSETPKENYVVKVLCSTPEHVTEEEEEIKPSDNTPELQETVTIDNNETKADNCEADEEAEESVLGEEEEEEEEEEQEEEDEDDDFVEVPIDSEEVSREGEAAEDVSETTVHEVEIVVPQLQNQDEQPEEESSPSLQEVEIEKESTSDSPAPEPVVDVEDDTIEIVEDGTEAPSAEAEVERETVTEAETVAEIVTEDSVIDASEEDKTEKDTSLASTTNVKSETPSVAEEDTDGGAKKLNKKRLFSVSESKPGSPAFHMIEDTKEYRSWKKSIMLVFNRMATHKFASIFLRPITNEQAPAYDTVIHRPVDLSTIKKRIETGELRSTVEFQRDLMLMFQNAIMYNNCRSLVYEMATTMQKECMQHIELMVDAMGEGVPWRKEPGINTRGRAAEAPKRKRTSLNDDKIMPPSKIKKEAIG